MAYLRLTYTNQVPIENATDLNGTYNIKSHWSDSFGTYFGSYGSSTCTGEYVGYVSGSSSLRSASGSYLYVNAPAGGDTRLAIFSSSSTSSSNLQSRTIDIQYHSISNVKMTFSGAYKSSLSSTTWSKLITFIKTNATNYDSLWPRNVSIYNTFYLPNATYIAGNTYTGTSTISKQDTFTITSSDTSIATVSLNESSQIVLNAIAAGTTTITITSATDSSKTSSTTITIAPVLDLTKTNWIINSEPIINTFSSQTLSISFSIDFVSNANTYSTFGMSNENDGIIYYGDAAVYNDCSYAWANSAYRIISITGGTDITNANLVSWLVNNATQTVLTDLSGTNWDFDDNPSMDYNTFSITFTSNDQTFTSLTTDYMGMQYDDTYVYEIDDWPHPHVGEGSN